MQVLLHNLPWSCTWQKVKDTFAAITQNIKPVCLIISLGAQRPFLLSSCFLHTF